ERVHGARTRTDEPDVAVLTDVGEMGVLGQKAVTGMDGIDICDFRRADYAIYAQITLGTGSFADANGFVRQLHVHRICIHLGIDRHGADVQLLAGANDADGNFAPVRYQNLLKHLPNECCGTAEPSELTGLSIAGPRSGRSNLEQRLAELHGFGVFQQDLCHDPFGLSLDFVHHLHRFDDADDRLRVDFGANIDVRGRFRRWCAVKSADHW